MALSSCEAEIMAASEGTKEAMYLSGHLSEMGLHDGSAIEMGCDNQAAIALANNPEYHDKSKHIKRRHFFVREAVKNEEIVVPYVRTVDNFADFFTMPIVGHNFFRMRDVIMNCDSRASKAAGRAMALRAIPERRMAPPAAAVVSREWTRWRGLPPARDHNPTSDPRWCEVTASGMVSQHYACDRDNACAVASAPCCGRAMLARSAVLRNPPPSDGGAFGRELTLTHNTIVRTHAPCSVHVHT